MNVREVKKRPFRWFLVVLLLALLSNAGLFFVTAGRGSGSVFNPLAERVGGSIFSVVPLDDQTIVVTTLGNEITIQAQGQVLAQTTVPAAVFGVVYLPDSQEILVGASNGRVYAYERHLNKLSETSVKGNVLGLALLDNGRVAVAHGVGAHGDRFYVSILDEERRQVASTYQVGVRLTALGSLGALAIYGTQEARVGAVDIDGVQRWDTQVRRQITVVRGWPARKQILVGDAVGNVYLFDNTGTALWEANLTQFKIGAIEPLGDDMIAVGDSDGSLYLLDKNGRLLLAQATQNPKDPVAAIYPLDRNRLAAVRQSGQAVVVDPQALVAAQLTQTLRPIWYGLDVLWLILLLLTLIRAVERWRRAVSQLLRRVYRARTAYLFLLPSLLLIVLFVYLTTSMAIYYSTTDYIPGDPIRFVGLRNFATIFTKDKYFWTGFGNMLLILVTSTIKVLTMPLAVALLVFHLRNPKAQYILRTAFILPSIVPGIVLTMMWKMMYDPGTHGFVNAVLRAINLPQFQRAWLGDERTAIWAIIFAGFPWVGAFSFLIYLGGLININTELFDAGAIDGVNWLGRLRYIEWPLLAPQRNLLLFFTYLGAIQSYEGIWVYTQGGPGHATYVPALQLYLNLSQGMKVGYASAIGFVLFLMVLAVTILNRRLQQRSEVA